MKENPENKKDTRVNPSATPKLLAAAAAIIAFIQACLTINGRGVLGFVLWVIVFFVAYWLVFTFLFWVVRRFTDRR
jgi:flagellar biosynthesis protein FliQ